SRPGLPGRDHPCARRESDECDSLLDRGVLSKSHIGAGDPAATRSGGCTRPFTCPRSWTGACYIGASCLQLARMLRVNLRTGATSGRIGTGGALRDLWATRPQRCEHQGKTTPCPG